MPNTLKKVTIKRWSLHGCWDKLEIKSNDEGFRDLNLVSVNIFKGEEDSAVLDLVKFFDEYLSFRSFNINYEHLKSEILQGFQKLKENDLTGDSEESIDFIVIPIDPHISCKENGNSHNSQESPVNYLSQTEVRKKLKTVEESSTVMRFFQENKCSVCLNNYKEILDEDLHIVIPSCGHPLCCKCADNILHCENKECPQCRGEITADSFNRMKFNADLKFVDQKQRVYL